MNTRTAAPPARLEARVDLAALRSNVHRLREIAGPARVMAVVKADAYGHGLVRCARAAVEAGAAWLGTALPEEALTLRAAGLEVPILTWLHAPGDDFAALLRAGVDVSISGQWSLHEVLDAAEGTGRPARIQLKADTGLGRNGIQPHDWPLLVDEAVKAERAGLLEVTGLWSHFACADEPGHPSIRSQLTRFHEALEYAESAGLRDRLRHMANSPATLTLPESHFDLVRPGVAVYGLSPAPELGTPADFGLRPVMTLRGRLALVKRVPVGHAVSYGQTYRTESETRLGLVPAGYADGIPRAASGKGPVWIGGRRYVIAGRVAMDQFVVDLGPGEAGRFDRGGAEPGGGGQFPGGGETRAGGGLRDGGASGGSAEIPGREFGGDELRGAGLSDPGPTAGDEVVLFGPGDQGEPTAQDWAEAIGTIGYEVVTRIGARVPRMYVD